MREFLGIKARYEHSSVSGGTRRIYTGEPETMIVPFYEEVTATDSVAIPKAYLIPREWTSVLDVLKAHGIRMRQLTEERTISVQSYLFSNVAFRSRPYEGRFGVTSMKAEAITETRTYPKGSWVVHTDQPGGRVAVHLLEPKAPDSFLSWGFFNAIFEQKEYVESYVMEKVGAEMLAADAMLRQEFENRIKSDSTFARNPDARLNWLYNRSKWADPWLNKYPVGRVVSAESLRLVE